MKRLCILAALAAPLLAQQPFDFRTLDKLDALASNKTKITLDSTLLGLAAGILGNGGDKDTDSIAALVKGLKGVYVRTYQFDKDGQYTSADVEPFRAYLKQLQWSRIVESQEGKELSEVYVQPLANGRIGGVGVVATSPRELTVVYINGEFNLSDLGKLEGNFGIPGMVFRGTQKSDNKADKKKDDDNQ